MRVAIENKLNFNNYAKKKKKKCTKAAQDLSGFSKRDGYLNKDKVNIL